jgi:hypothetical protein
VRVDQPTDNPDQLGIILATDPKPGSEVAYGVVVNAAVGVPSGDGNGNGGGGGGDD